MRIWPRTELLCASARRENFFGAVPADPAAIPSDHRRARDSSEHENDLVVARNVTERPR